MLKVGDKVLICDISNKGWTDGLGLMEKYSMKIMTVKKIVSATFGVAYKMKEDSMDNGQIGWYWKVYDCELKNIEV